MSARRQMTDELIRALAALADALSHVESAAIVAPFDPVHGGTMHGETLASISIDIIDTRGRILRVLKETDE